MACGFFPGKGSGCSLACPGGERVSVWCSSAGGLVLLGGLYGLVPCRASPAWCLCRAQFLVAPGETRAGSIASVVLGAQLAEATVFYQQSHHHSSFLVHLQVEADLSLPAHLKAEPSASEKLVSPA